MLHLYNALHELAREFGLDWCLDFGILAEVSPDLAIDFVLARPEFDRFDLEARTALWARILTLNLIFMSDASVNLLMNTMSTRIPEEEINEILRVVEHQAAQINQRLRERDENGEQPH